MRRSIVVTVAAGVLAVPVVAAAHQVAPLHVGGGPALVQQEVLPPAAPAPTGFAATRAVCGPDDAPEQGLQGEVGAGSSVFLENKGYRCNARLIGKHTPAEGVGLQLAWYGSCAYAPSSVKDSSGSSQSRIVVIDFSDPAAPRQTALLDGPAVTNPHESLKVNPRRGLLGAVESNGSRFDVYDVKTDCRRPRLLASVTLPNSIGHEGDFAPDGMTYYGSSILNAPDVSIVAIDLRDPRRPRELLAYQSPFIDATAGFHGLQFSPDGRTGYWTPQAGPGNGFAMMDLSDVQDRKPNPTIRVIGRTTWTTSGAVQVALRARIGGRQYALVPDEFGAQLTPARSCSAGKSPFGYVHVVDVTDQRQPKEVSKVALEVNDPANCVTTMTQHASILPLTFSSHYCSVDDPENTTALACGWMGSGLRVFDVRDVMNPKEIAYFNPQARGQLTHVAKLAIAPNPLQDVSPTNVRWQRLPNGSARLWFSSLENGVQVVELSRAVYPLRSS